MRKLFQHFLCGTLLLISVNLLANDCVNCGPKNVSGMPGNTTFDMMEKIAKKGAGSDRDYVMGNYCLKFSQIPQQMVGTTIKEMEGTGISVEDYLTSPVCQPDGYSDAVKSPMIHKVADDPNKREEFLNNIWLYYSKKRKQPEVFTQAINAKNTKGETILDYIETMKSRNFYPIDSQQPPLDKIIAMLCSHGGVYATNKDKKCP